MEVRSTRPTTYGMTIDENTSLSQLTVLIEISIGHTHSILHSIEDFTRLPKPAGSGLRNRDSGYSEARVSIDGSDLGRKLLNLQHKVEENRALLRDLQRANLYALQVILEDSEAFVITALQNNIKTNWEASNELHHLADSSPSLYHVSKSRLGDILPPRVNISPLKNRLSQVLSDWRLPFPNPNARLRLCNSAKLLNSGTDNGVLEQVRDAQLRISDKKRLNSKGGSFQFWKCPICDFHVRYHATHSKSLSIETTDDTRTPREVHVSLRTIFLAKSHLHMQPGQLLRYACIFCTGSGQRIEEGKTAFAKEDELARHIDTCHDVGSLPRLFMKKLYIAGPEETSEDRCDIQFHRTRSLL